MRRTLPAGQAPAAQPGPSSPGGGWFEPGWGQPAQIGQDDHGFPADDHRERGDQPVVVRLREPVADRAQRPFDPADAAVAAARAYVWKSWCRSRSQQDTGADCKE